MRLDRRTIGRLKKISSNKIKENNHLEFENQFIKRNYYLLKHQLLYLLDSGLDFLKREYVKRNSETSFMEFTSQNYYDFILKDYIRKKIKNQINSILNSGLLCINHIENDVVDPDFLDHIIDQKYPEYASNDLSLLHSSNSHPGYSELKMISRLTYRITIIQVAYILACHDSEIKTYIQLMKKVFPTKKESQDALNSIFSMFNQMVDCFERHLQMITIPFYKPTFNIRDFQFVRICYEFAIKVVDEQLNELYPEEE